MQLIVSTAYSSMSLLRLSDVNFSSISLILQGQYITLLHSEQADDYSDVTPKYSSSELPSETNDMIDSSCISRASSYRSMIESY